MLQQYQSRLYECPDREPRCCNFLCSNCYEKKDLFNLIRAVEFAVNKNIFRAMLIESTRHQQF